MLAMLQEFVLFLNALPKNIEISNEIKDAEMIITIRYCTKY